MNTRTLGERIQSRPSIEPRSARVAWLLEIYRNGYLAPAMPNHTPPGATAITNVWPRDWDNYYNQAPGVST